MVDVLPPVVADRQLPVTSQPRERALDHPAVATEALARFHSFARDADLDAAARQGFEDDLVVRETIYFGDPFEAPAWRKPWVEPST